MFVASSNAYLVAFWTGPEIPTLKTKTLAIWGILAGASKFLYWEPYSAVEHLIFLGIWVGIKPPLLDFPSLFQRDVDPDPGVVFS